MSNDNSTSQSTSSTPTFEQSMQELEAIVSKMEQGELSLEDALANFERGIKLARASQEQLKAAEQKVQILMQQSADAPLQDFDSSEPSE